MSRKSRRAERVHGARIAERRRLHAKRHEERPARSETWGGRREGAGRPRVYATNADRQAAYRRRIAPGSRLNSDLLELIVDQLPLPWMHVKTQRRLGRGVQMTAGIPRIPLHFSTSLADLLTHC